MAKNCCPSLENLRSWICDRTDPRKLIRHPVRTSYKKAHIVRAGRFPSLEWLTPPIHPTKVPQFAVIIMGTGCDSRARRIHREGGDHLSVVFQNELMRDGEQRVFRLVFGRIKLGFFVHRCVVTSTRRGRGTDVVRVELRFFRLWLLGYSGTRARIKGNCRGHRSCSCRR